MSKSSVTTQVYSGRPLRDVLLAQVADAVQELNVRLCVLQVGDNPASTAYIRNKLAACERVGIEAGVIPLTEDAGEAVLHEMIRQLAADESVHGIVVQTPLPAGWDVHAALDLVPAAKDIDGLSRESEELRRADNPHALLPATPLGVMRLLKVLNVDVKAAKICVIGKGMVVGKPLREMLQAAGATIVGIEKETPSPAALAKSCDVVIAAAGAPGLVTEEWLQPGAIVIDVGITRVTTPDGEKLVGDVARDRIEGTASVVTPVPGGVGPMTVASLLTNLADAACLQVGRERVRWVIDDWA